MPTPGERLRLARLAAGLTQSELATRAANSRVRRAAAEVDADAFVHEQGIGLKVHVAIRSVGLGRLRLAEAGSWAGGLEPDVQVLDQTPVAREEFLRKLREPPKQVRFRDGGEPEPPAAPVERIDETQGEQSAPEA